MATKQQIQIIHVAKQKLGMSDEDYKALLSSYDVTSSKQLYYNEAKEIIEKFAEMGFVIKSKKPETKGTKRHGFGKEKFENLRGSRNGLEYADPSQLRMIEALWRENSREKTDESLRRMIKRIAHVDDITFLTSDLASKIIIAVEKLKAKNNE